VKILDILMASAVLETLAAGCVLIVLVLLFAFVGIDVMPIDIAQACYAFGAAVLLGIGVGLTNGVIVFAFPAWFTGYTLFSILLWITAGIFFVPDALPSLFRDLLAYDPIVQDIEWARSAYYEGYGSLILDRGYTVAFGVAAIFLGLVLERITRGYVLAWR
jgi:capsular polysaccharide transport system permease protein